MNGADSGSPNKKGLTQEEVKKAKEHPVFGLLGGTRRMFRSTLITETANQVSPAAISVGAVPEKYKGISFPENESGQVIMFRRVDDALSFNDPEAQNVIENYEDAMKTWIEGTSDSKKKRKAAKDAGEDVKGGAKIDTWSCMEVIIPGVSFYFNIEVDSEYEYHGAIVAMGLEKLINQQSLGGWTRNGMGRFSVHDVQISRGDKSAELFVYEGEDVKLNTQNDFVAGVVKSGQDALNSLTKENLEEIVSVAAGGK
jgi:CRISPR type IV-associated protein Csf2